MENGTIEESSTAVLTEQNRNAAVKRVAKRQTISVLYNEFRQSGLSKMDSAFNALYISQTNKFCSKHVKVNNVGDGFFNHPHGWFKEKEERIRRATHTKTLRLLELSAKMLSHFSSSVEPTQVRSGFFFDNSEITLRNLRRSFKKAVPACLSLVCAALLITTVYINSQKDTVIEFSINGETAGQVASAKTVDAALDRITSSISAVTNEAFSFPCEISYKVKNVSDAKCLDIDGVYDILSDYTEDYTTLGYGLYVDSELIAVLDNRDDIVSVLDTVKSEHMQLTGEDEDIANRIDIKYQEYSPDSIIEKDALLAMFEAPAEESAAEEAPYKALLARPTTLSSISLEEATPEFQEQLEAALASNSSTAIVLDFEVSYEETEREAVPFETEYIEDDSFYQGQEFVQVTGRSGTADNTYKVKYINGEESGRILIEQNIIRAPRTCVIKVGTRVLPENLPEEKRGDKYMINPVPTATITSHYGWRVLRGKSDYHEGLDFAAPKNTPIYACASGEVIYAGYSYSYGNHIKIRHEDGTVTLYAHCTELLVSAGDTVSQADEIGLVGTTGNSTGNHCHLEVFVDGCKVDPEDYIYSLD